MFRPNRLRRYKSLTYLLLIFFYIRLTNSVPKLYQNKMITILVDYIKMDQV